MDFTVNLQPYDIPYCVTERKADTITLRHGEESLVLDTKNIRRETVR